MELQLRCPSHNSSLNPTNVNAKKEKNPTNVSSKCFACYEENHDNKPGYMCNLCNFYVHEKCINTIIPSRHKHPLKITRYMYHSCYCFLCESRYPSIYIYQCSQCSFSICIPCARKPLIINKSNVHEHELHQLPIKLSFTCDACGLCSTDQNDQYPSICHQCCFIIHRRCINLPRVICISRHDHRISYVHSLGPGKWICRVCRKLVNGECGAYSCLICPNYVVHSRCATRNTIWDGKELENVPEEDESKPFEMIDQNLIKHFSHEHNLKVSVSTIRLEEDVLPREEDKYCYACTMPLYSELCYKCPQCDFILHDACANLPRKKRHGISSNQLTLIAKVEKYGGYGAYYRNYFYCIACRRYCTGFAYGYFLYRNYVQIDMRCASISNEFKHESHPHWLFVSPNDKEEERRCDVCHYSVEHSLYLRCNEVRDCDGYILCFRCATLPTTVKHKYDDHPLSLHYGEKNVNSTYYCGICEEKINLKGWFYRCNDCDSTLHTECVFKNMIHSRPGYSLEMGFRGTFDLIPNRLSRPICYLCKNRCTDDLVLNQKADKNIFLCCSCGF